MRPLGHLVVVGLLVTTFRPAFASTAADSLALQSDPLVQKIVALRHAQEARETPKIDAFYAADARVWYEEKTGPGQKRAGGEGGWAQWDRAFRSKSEALETTRDGDAVSVVLLESNDFYRLIDRAPSKVRLTYWFDAAGKITGTLVAGMRDGAKDTDRLDEFKAWARDNRPETLEYLMPEGKIVPDRDHAEKWRAVLTEWRAAAGLPAID